MTKSKYEYKGLEGRTFCTKSSFISFQSLEVCVTRSNLRGIALSETCLPWGTFSIVNLSLDPKSQVSTGFAPEITKTLALMFNFTLDLSFPDDRQWGGLSANGTWTGMVGQLVSKKADISSSSLSISHQRHMAIDFTQPILLDQITLVGQVGISASLNVWAYVTVFSGTTWFLIWVNLIILGLLFLSVKLVSVDPLVHESGQEPFGLVNCAGMIGMLLLQMSYPIHLQSWSAKFIHFCQSMRARTRKRTHSQLHVTCMQTRAS